LILLTLVLGALLQQETPPENVFRFEVEVRTVFIDVFVSRDGSPVRGLTANDFEIVDQGAPQQLDLVDPQDIFLSVMLVLDTSSSVSGSKLAHLREAAHAFLRRLKEKDEAGLMMFHQYAHLRQAMGGDIRFLHESLDQPTQGGYTSIHDALYTGLKLVGEAEGRPMVLLFTDGEDNSSWLTEKELVNVARESEAIVHVIGLKSSNERVTSTIEDSGGKKKSLNHSNSLNQAENLLEEITKVTGGRVWYADSSAELEQVFLKVLEEMETRYLLSYQLLGVPSEGWHELEVKLKKQRGETIRARPGYVAITSKP
jgi:Ca-activated chloride channel family protein